MRVSRSLLVVIAVILTASCGATLVPYTDAQLDPIPEVSGWAEWEIARAIEQSVETYLEEHDVPGVQVALRVGDRLYAGAYGHRDNRRSEFARVDDIYRVGSVTKTFTAVVILQLVAEGRISLDDTIGGWVDLPNAERVTVRQLLNHSSGIPSYTDRWLPNLGTTLRPRRQWRPEQLLSRVQGQEQLFAPGSSYHYSNSNYVALGLIAEAVTGRRMHQLYRTRILEPVGLSDTFFLPYEDGPEAERLVTGYDRDIQPLWTRRVTERHQSWLTYGYSAGAMVSTAADLVRFVDALFDGLLLAPEERSQMTTFIPAADRDLPQQTGYGLGLRQLTGAGAGGIVLGHTGSTPGFGAAVLHAPDADYTIAAVGNLSRFDALPLIEAVLADLRETAAWRIR